MTSIFSGTDVAMSRLPGVDAAMLQAKSKLSAKKMSEIDKSAKDFEGMFISQMLQPMFETVKTDSEFGGGEAEDTWKGLMIEQYGKDLSAAGGIGLSDSIKAKMIEMQEIAQSAQARTSGEK
jgi:Rod binding domain-containing protein